MKLYYASLAVIVVVVIACAQAGILPKVSGDIARSAYSGLSERYIYVADRVGQKLLVYSSGQRNPAPIRSVSFGTGAIGVATDSSGHVYVTLGNSTVAIFDSGAVTRLGTLGASEKINAPSGVTIDSGGNLWVANRGTPSYVNEYTGPNSQLLRTVYLPNNFVASGIAVSKAGDLWVDMAASQGGFVVEYPAGQKAVAKIIRPDLIGTAGLGGIAFDAHGNLEVGTIGDIFTYAPPDWKRVNLQYFGSGLTIHEMTSGSDGSLYIPFESRYGQSSVLVEPALSASRPYYITQGISVPNGAAAGI